MKDTYRHKGLRKKLVETLRQKGISNPTVLSAIELIPRHYFLDRAFEEMAYRDMPFQIGKNQTISQPFIVAYQTERMDIRRGEKVLEIGTGSGYQSAILSQMGAHVYTIERYEYLLSKAISVLKPLSLQNIRFKLGDGFLGWEEESPFDKIIITAAPEEIPKNLLQQLKIGGKLISPTGKKNHIQKMVEIARTSENSFSYINLIDCKFVPMIKGVIPEPGL